MHLRPTTPLAISTPSRFLFPLLSHTTTKMPAPITVYIGGLNPNKYSWSPFVAKLETRLRLAHVPYLLEAGSFSAAPKGKIPYVSLPTTPPTLLGDSALITSHLVGIGTLPALNAALSPAQAATDLALRALLEDRLYFHLVRERWVTNFYLTRDEGPLSPIPWPLRILVGIIASRRATRTLWGQGTGRYSDEEEAERAAEAWDAVATVVGAAKKKGKGVFWALGGAEPTELDACLFGYLAGVLTACANPDTLKMVRARPVLVEYASRIHDQYFPDYDKWED